MKTNSKTETGMGFWSIVLMGLGAVIGAGVVTYSGIAVGLTGRSAWIAYAVAILLGFLCNLPLILMTTAARIKGGNYSFIATTLGDLGGGYYGISRVLMVLSFSTFSLSFGNYMNIIFPMVPVKVFAYGALIRHLRCAERKARFSGDFSARLLPRWQRRLLAGSHDPDGLHHRLYPDHLLQQ